MPGILQVCAQGGRNSFAIVAGQSVRDILDATELRVRAACGGTGNCGACVVRWLSGECNPPTLAEYQKLTAEERAAGLRLACQLRPAGDMEIRLDHPAPASAWKSIAPGDLWPVPGCLPGLADCVYGLAVDLGTTHIRLALWDRKRGHRIATRLGPNPQGAFGADVLNRLETARARTERAAELAGLARAAIVQALRDMLAREVGEVKPMLAKIGQVVVAGNTAMLALLSGQGAETLLNPAHWELPVDIQPPDARAFQAEWLMPNAVVTLLPPLGGFVGSDLLADLAATQLTATQGAAFLLDIGTNTEIALWDGAQLLVTSSPGGPAFEGVGIRNGMAAESGAIWRVAQGDGGFDCDVIGGGGAHGLCGSGLVDAVALLLRAGTLKPSGRFATPPGPEGYPLIPGNPRSALFGLDIDAFQRAKAACGAAMGTLLRRAGLRWADIRRLCVCGAFGHTLDIGHAQAVGLLPGLERGRIELYANATLAGCERALLLPEGMETFRRLARQAWLTNLSLDSEYDENYIDHLRLVPLPIS